MTTSIWYDDLPVIGKLPPSKAAKKLLEVNEDDAAEELESVKQSRKWGRKGQSLWPFKDKPWQHTAHAFGYLAPAAPDTEMLSIQDAGNISADTSLKNARIKITLDRLRVAEYPGGGTHRVLFDFYAQNQVVGNVEHLHFNATYRVREGEQAAIRGYPIFVGLNVNAEGIAFKCFTINVKNEDDESLLGFLESDVFKQGLKLASATQPAIGLLSETAIGLTKAIAKRNRNVPVQDFYLGLDFSNIPTGARLAEGAYVVVQIPETSQSVWDWGNWVFNKTNGQIVNISENKQLIPYNYLVFSVSRYEGD